MTHPMRKAVARQAKIHQYLLQRGTGVINVSNAELSAVLGIPVPTLKRDLDVLNNDLILIRETHLINKAGKTVRQRDIILVNQEARRYTINQHRQLSSKANHNIFLNEHDEVIWNINLDGKEHRIMEEKEFEDIHQALHWCYWTTQQHRRKWLNGDKYTSRS